MPEAMKGSQMDLNVVAHFLHHVTALPVERGARIMSRVGLNYNI